MDDTPLASRDSPQSAGVLPVSAIIPAYNRAEVLPRAIASIRDQELKPSEIIVVDDCSTDRTAEVAEELGVRVVRHERNRGAAAARNTALRHASYDWFANLDSDDEWLDNHLKTLWPLRNRHVFVAGSLISNHESRDYLFARHSRVLSGPKALILPYNTVPSGAVLARREAALAVGGYDESLRFAEDWDLLLRMLEVGTGLQVPVVVARAHRHESQKSMTQDPVSVERRQVAQRRIVDSCVTRGSISRRTARMRRGAVAWDASRTAIAMKDYKRLRQVALRPALDPFAIAGALRLIGHRIGMRIRMSGVSVEAVTPRSSPDPADG